MAEPLTKDKIITSKEIEDQGGNFKFLELKDLKSALEEFEKRISSRLDADSCLVIAKQELKKAFPAIYGDKEGGK